MRKLMFMLVCAVFMTACGGGGSGTLTSASTPQNPGTGSGNVTVSGKVAGTDVIAVDSATDSVVARQTATLSGADKVFSIKVQSGKSYKFFFVENVGTSFERAYPLFIGVNNLFTIASAGTFDLGFISTASGNAMPTNIPAQLAGSVSGTTIPSGIMTNSTSIFTTTDLQGTWYFFQYITGANPYWARATYTVDANGNATSSNGINSSGGTGQTGTKQLTISPSGMIAVAGDMAATATKMYMSSSKQLIVGSGGSTGEESQYIGIKAASGFNQSDLTGTWRVHTFLGASSWRDWERQDMSITSNGLLSITNTTSGSGTATISGVTGLPISINAGGIISLPSGGPNGFYGVMTSDKNIAVATWTNDDGSVAIGLFVKTGGAGFSVSDLKGSWRTAGIGSSTTSFAWFRSLMVVDASGYASTFDKYVNGGLVANQLNGGPAAISPSGKITIGGQASAEGSITAAKDFIVLTQTDNEPSSSIYFFSVSVK